MAHSTNLSTIGFTKTTAEHFFARLSSARVRRVLDVRLRNTSQLAGFAKAEDLEFFLKTISNIEYQHLPLLAPEDAMLDRYKKAGGSWLAYEMEFRHLMEQRKIETRLSPEIFEGACLLCSEDKPHHCHRRLVCEYLNERWGGILSVRHL